MTYKAIVAGKIAANAFDTAGGTESGILIVISANINLQKMITEIAPMIITVK